MPACFRHWSICLLFELYACLATSISALVASIFLLMESALFPVALAAACSRLAYLSLSLLYLFWASYASSHTLT